MSNDPNNFAPTTRSWETRRGYGDYAPNRYELTARSIPRRSTPDAYPWLPVEERAITGPYSMASFPVQPHPPLRILVFDNDMARQGAPMPMPRPFVQESPSRFTGQWNMQPPTQAADSRMTQDEQKTTLKKLRKEIYNPTPKKILRRLSLYYRDDSRNNYNEKGKEKDDDDEGKRCAICLDDFEPKEEVMLTPCNHMFHEDCILPWVKSHGLCPVCRFAICERMQQSTLPPNTAAANDLFAGELMAIIRTMDGFGWGTVNR